ncbi:MAG: hypothetical protein GX620_17060, partial [Chloroflexi bacterium]|nr:hypothetical protein [Chloroflexota bacterium]
MGAAPAIAILLSIAVGVLAPDALPSAIPFVLAWLISPWIAGVISRPARPRRRSVSQPQRRQLRRVARRMWRYFEEYVGPNDNWLPPDHYQEHPNGLLAHRTSPTNVGLALLSTLAAYDLGYTGPLALVLRLRSTMDAMERMERYRGHFFNWYETQQLSPLPPRYVSTVDSGNLAGCLIALKHGLTEMLNRPTLDWPVWQGFQDALSVLEETVAELRPSDESEPGHRVTKRIAQLRERIDAQREMPGQWYRLLDELIGREWDGLEELLGALVDIDSSAIPSSTLHELGAWTTLAIEHLYDMKDTFDTLMPWTELMANSPAILRQPTLHPVVGDAWESLQHTLDAIPTIGAISAVCSKALEQVGEVVKSITSCQEELMAFPSSGETGEVTAEVREALGWCTELSEALRNARLTAETYVIGIDLLVVQAEAYLRKMDFSFLFDDQRKVFHIGLDVDAGQLDPNYYDLLASEARIASIVAIAKGDVPQEHWLHLGRPMTSVEGKPTLLSWSGTMFEYLMPTLLMKTYPGSLLERSVQSVIGYQISYAQRRKVPWGISESGYYHFDAARNYQYRAFGAPGVGFKRGLDEDLVIAPYASLLALPFRPEDVMDNIERFEQIGMLGPYGLYEAIDYTPSRVARSEHGAIVRSYMVHHHGMSLLAIANTLLNRSMVGRFHADPRIQTIELLLQEQVPAQVPLEYPSRMPSLAADVLPQIETGPWETSLSTTFPQVHALSNGAYSVIVTAAGGGYSAWEGLSLTRWRPDTTLDEWGTWLYVKDLEDNTLWSATAQPIRLQGV